MTISREYLEILNITYYQILFILIVFLRIKKNKNIFIKQNNWIAIISIIIGLPLGYFLFKVAIINHYDFSIYITLKTYLSATIGTLNILLSIFILSQKNY